MNVLEGLPKLKNPLYAPACSLAEMNWLIALLSARKDRSYINQRVITVVGADLQKLRLNALQKLKPGEHTFLLLGTHTGIVAGDIHDLTIFNNLAQPIPETTREKLRADAIMIRPLRRQPVWNDKYTGQYAGAIGRIDLNREPLKKYLKNIQNPQFRENNPDWYI